MLKYINFTKPALLILAGIMVLNVIITVVHIKFQQLKNTQLTNTKITLNLREQQLDCLTKNIYYEAGSEPFEGKVGVAQVTLNRAESSGFPGDICRVVYQKNIVYDKLICQFSWYCETSSRIKPVYGPAYAESYEVAKKVLLENFRLNILKDAMYFHATNITPNWNHEKIATIGHHIFYK
jgi:spore germination cell wall hydrolase CwlJ-like protein